MYSQVLVGQGNIFCRKEFFRRISESHFFHDIAALVRLGGFIIHICERTAAMPDTFRSMIHGTMSEWCAWTHHPIWYHEVTGRNPCEDYERARRRQAERRRMSEAWAREQIFLRIGAVCAILGAVVSVAAGRGVGNLTAEAGQRVGHAPRRRFFPLATPAWNAAKFRPRTMNSQPKRSGEAAPGH
jgi:hypothetical protein